MQKGDKTFSGIMVIIFNVMYWLRESFDVSSRKEALRRSMPFRKLVNILSDRLSTLKERIYFLEERSSRISFRESEGLYGNELIFTTCIQLRKHINNTVNFSKIITK